MPELAIKTIELRKNYASVAAVSGLNLSVPRGSIYGLLGRNGAGKSTTIRMLLGMARPSGGRGWVLGHAIDSPAESLEIRRRTGFVGEDKGLYDFMTVEQLIAFTRPFFPRWRHDLEKKYLAAFELPLGRKVRALSKGMRTKLALLVALARGADMLILDEPTEGLDPAVVEQVLQAIISLAAEQELTVFFSSHQIAEVEQIADHICIIHRGRVAVAGALDELKESYRRVNLVFDEAATASEFTASEFVAPGIEQVQRDGRWLSLLVSRNVTEVVNEARARSALSVDVVPVTLKEIFLESVRHEEK